MRQTKPCMKTKKKRKRKEQRAEAKRKHGDYVGKYKQILNKNDI